MWCKCVYIFFSCLFPQEIYIVLNDTDCNISVERELETLYCKHVIIGTYQKETCLDIYIVKHDVSDCLVH